MNDTGQLIAFLVTVGIVALLFIKAIAVLGGALVTIIVAVGLMAALFWPRKRQVRSHTSSRYDPIRDKFE